MRDKREIKRVFEGIVDIYNNDRFSNGNPSATIQKAVEEYGKDAVRETIAVAVNHKTWDGRIYRPNKEWAANVTEMGLGDDHFLNGIDKIHPAHLDQLADAIRKYLNESTKRKTAHRAMREEVGEDSDFEIERDRLIAYRGNDTHVVVPKGVRIIGDWAFREATQIQSIDTGDADAIGRAAFYGCTKLSEIIAPNVRIVGHGAFTDCRSLKDVVMPEVGFIDDEAFLGCMSLKIAKFPKAVSIGRSAFKGCAELRNLKVPQNVKVGSEALLFTPIEGRFSRSSRRNRVNESMSDALEASNKNILRPEDMSFTVAVSPTYGTAMEMSRKFKDRALKAYREVEERSKGITVPHETPILPKTNIYTGKMWRNDEPKRTNESRRNIKRMRTLAEGDLSDAAGIPGDVYAFVYDALFGFPVAKNIKALRGAKYGDYQYVTGLERTRYGKNTYDIGVYTNNKDVGRAKSIAELLDLDFHFYPRESTVYDDEGNDVTFEGIAVVEIPDSIWHTPIEDYFEQIGKKATDEVDKFRKTYYNAKAKK